jgi:ferrous iron transport protein A
MSKSVRLSSLKVGQKAIIENIDDDCINTVLYEMGFLPNEPIILENIAPLGDPILINNFNYNLSIRKEDAAHIWVSIIEE